MVYNHESFFKWKKIFVRSVHLMLVLFISGNLFVKNTELREALVFQDYPYVCAYVGLTYLSLLFFFVTCFKDPGFVEHAEEDTEEDLNPELKNIMVKIKSRYCETCQLHQPLRSRHCDSCDRCVNKFDHHCPWLETCIGAENHNYFWAFLLTTSTLALWSIVITSKAFTRHKTWKEWFAFNLLYLFNMQVLVIGLLVMLSLFLIHTYFMFTNTTTWERFSRKNITYLKIIKNEKLNPFHIGYLSNVKEFLCYPRGFKWETIYAQFIKNKYNKLIENESSNSSSEDPDDIKLTMQEIHHMNIIN